MALGRRGQFSGPRGRWQPRVLSARFCTAGSAQQLCSRSVQKIDILQWGQWGWDGWGWWGWWGFLRIYLIFIVFFKHLEGIKRDCTDAFAVLSAA